MHVYAIEKEDKKGGEGVREREREREYRGIERLNYS